MCFGGKTQTSVTANQLPEWMSTAGKSNYDSATAIASRDYPTYSGPRVANFAPDESAAFDLMRGTEGAWKPTANAATGALTSQLTNGGVPANVSRYMSPYISEVVDRSIADVTRQGEVARRGIKQRAHGAGAFGDARHGIADAELDRNVLNAAGNISAQGRQAAYDEAIKAFMGDQAQTTATAGQAGSLAQLMQKMGLTDVGGLLQTGGAQRQMTQQNYDTAYQDFLNQFYYPIEGLNLQSSALSGTPYTKTQTQTSPGGDSFATTAGGIAALLGGGAKAASLFM